MRVPLSWLREYVDFDDDVNGLAEKLTFSGIEVEGIEQVRGGLEGVIVGKITAIGPHPNADRLKICTVTDGKNEHQVVCGADNMTEGDKAAFAPTGTKLPGGMKIRKAKVRGEESFGMLCAEDELGLSDTHEGLYLVDKAVPTGTGIYEVVGAPDDVLDLEITWNRPDCLSIIGIAREVAALYRSKLLLPETDLEEHDKRCADMVAVEVKDFEACPRYSGRYLSHVKVAPSPGWMQSRLAACGVRPVNNVVDITNYVLLETGHPLHAFDYSRVADGRIVVRYAEPGETISTLDGEDRNLSNEILVIADSEAPLAIAGVMGGLGSQISDNTSEVLLESATFAPPLIHAAVSTQGLMSESSHRFERGVDFESVDFASRRAARLIAEVCGGKAATGTVDVHGGLPDRKQVKLSFDALNGVMGIDVPSEECKDILESLQFSVESSDGGLTVTVPGFRPDISIEADLIEEVARMKGLDAIPATPPVCFAAGTVDDTLSWRREEIREALVGLGFTETVNYSFMSEKLAGLDPSAPGVALPNPVSVDYSIMRGSLAPQMADMLGRNLARRNLDCACFEIGKVFSGPGAGIAESERICLGVMGKVGRLRPGSVSKTSTEEVFLWMKGAVEAIFESYGSSLSLEASDMEILESGSAVLITADGIKCGWMGALSTEIRDGYRMQDPVVIAEIELAALTKPRVSSSRIKPVPSFPSVTRDIAVVVDEGVLNRDILEVMYSIRCHELTRVELFDIFEGRGTGEDRKSMAYSLTFQAFDRTLTDDEANGFRDRIRDGLVNKLNAEIREG